MNADSPRMQAAKERLDRARSALSEARIPYDAALKERDEALMGPP